MKSASIEARVRGLAADIFSVAQKDITIDSSPGTIGTWDSLQHLNLVLAVEQEFDVQFTPEEVETLTTVNAFVELLERKPTSKAHGD
jgi:acyl carrier protein